MITMTQISPSIASILVLFCLGVSSTKQQELIGRIVGGKDAKIEDYPYQLSLEYRESHICGAAIISNDWAVTAAHCIKGLLVEEVRFRAGSSIKEKGGSLHPAKQFISHPDFREEPTDYDIAVVMVSKPFTYGPGVQPISLIMQVPNVGEMGTITGWGATDEAEKKYPTQLQMASIPIVDRKKCNDAYFLIGGITDDMLCAGFDEGGIDACHDDSGGPLVVGGKLAGIVSFGVQCALAGYPGIYASVAYLREFVVSKAGIKL